MTFSFIESVDLTAWEQIQHLRCCEEGERSNSGHGFNIKCLQERQITEDQNIYSIVGARY